MNQLPVLVQALALAQAEAAAGVPVETPHMTATSWVYMLAVWAAIVVLNVFCFYRLFSHGREVPRH